MASSYMIIKDSERKKTNEELFEELLPCPFCGDDLQQVMDDCVRCSGCDTEGPLGCSSKEGMILWNRRYSRRKSNV